MAYPYNSFGNYPYSMQQYQQQQSVGLVWIDGYNEAAMYPIAPNAAVLLRDKSDPSVIYLKWADATGKPSMLTFDERKEPQPTSKPRQTQSAAEYATKADLAGVLAEMDGLKQRLDIIAAKPAKAPMEKDVNE